MLFCSHNAGSSSFFRQLLSRFISIAALAVITGSAFAQVINYQSGYASADAGDWGGQGGAILGPPNVICANMGAIDKVNLVSGFGFSVPGGATITDVTAYPRAGATKAQPIEIQLASDASIDPPTLLGSTQNLNVPDTGGGSCATAIDLSVGGPLAGWGSPVLTPAIVNAATFGLSLITRERSTVKIDSICLEVRYTTDSGPAVQDQCITFPPVLTLVKEVDNTTYLGTALPSAWTLTADGPDNLSGITGSVDVTAVTVAAGDYTLGESGPAGYSGTWSCTGGGVLDQDGVSLTLADTNPAQETTCTLTNTAQPATLTLVKTLTVDNGSDSTLADWILTATGPAPFTVSGAANSASVVNQLVGAGNYSLNESGPPGFDRGPWNCVDTQAGAVASDPLVLANGANVTCTIVNDDLPSTLTLVKEVMNDNGGNAGVDEWTLSADGTGANDHSGTTSEWAGGFTVNADTYTLGESGPSGYTPSAWVCVDTQSGTVASDPLVLGNDRDVTCTITNTDVPATLVLSKTVNNSFGGNDAANTFPLTLTGNDGTHDGGVDYFSGGTQPTVVPGVLYTVSEVPNTGYQLANPGGIVCTDLDNAQNSPPGTTFTLTEGQNVSCVFSNEDIAPSLTLLKSVNGGALDPADFTLVLTGCNHAGTQHSSGDTPSNIESNCVYTLTELPEDGYASAGVSCVDTGNGDAPVNYPVTLNEGQVVSCTLTNDAVATGTITVIKQVNNNWNGPDDAADFDLQISWVNISGACVAGTDDFKSGESMDTETGCQYTVSETARPGYTQGTISCVDANDNDANLGHPFTSDGTEAAVCTIPNDDQPAQLALVKTVSGGDALPAEWLLIATDGGTTEQGQGGFASTDVPAGDWDLSESGGPSGYTPGAWSCLDGSGADFPLADADTVTLANGDIVTCTINNAGDATTLTLVKTLTEDGGGNADVDDWTLTADGTTDYSGTTTEYWAGGVSVDVDTYTLTENGGPDGYTPGAWVCEDALTGGVASDPLVLTTGQNVTCTIDNDDIAPTLTVVKNVVNNSGGNAVVESFTLTLQGDDGIHDPALEYDSGQSPPVKAGIVYTLDEVTEVTGYENTGVECVNNGDGDDPEVTDGSFTLTLDQDVTCTLTNDDIAPTLTLFKDVTNNNAGELEPGDFDLVLTSLTGDDPVHENGAIYKSGDSPVIIAAVQYEVSEIPETGYVEESIECVLNVDGEEDQPLPNPFTPQLGQDISCTVTNVDGEPTIVFWVSKDFTDDNDSQVQVKLSCNTGTYEPKDGWIVEGEKKGFVVSKFQPGLLSCKVEETSGPDGYLTTYMAGVVDGVADTVSDTEDKPGCYFEKVVSGAFTCDVVNTPAPVDLAVTKVWDISGSGGTDFSLDTTIIVRCDAEIVGGTKKGKHWTTNFELNDPSDYDENMATVTAQVIPEWYPMASEPDNQKYTECDAWEQDVESFVEVTNDCVDVEVAAGMGNSCTITNTVFFEGIPILNRYGMAIMVLLMLGVGMIGFRRFA